MTQRLPAPRKVTALAIAATLVASVPLGLGTGYLIGQADTPAVSSSPTSTPITGGGQDTPDAIPLAEGFPADIPLPEGPIVHSETYTDDTPYEGVCVGAPQYTYSTVSIEVDGTDVLPDVTEDILATGQFLGTPSEAGDNFAFLTIDGETTTGATETGAFYLTPDVLTIQATPYYNSTIVTLTYGSGNITCTG